MGQAKAPHVATPALSLKHVEKFNSQLTEIVALETSLKSLERETWLPKYYRRTGIPLVWAWAYCFTFSELLAVSLHSIGVAPEFTARLKSKEPYDGIFEFVENFDPDPKADKHYRRRLIVALPLLYAMVYSIRAVGYHSQTINELLTRGLNGEPVMLRNAIAVDPTVLSNPLVADHVARLHLRNEKKELALLYGAAAKGPRKKLQPNWQLRYMERVLAESNAIELHGRESIYELVTQRLKLYDARGADPYKALFTSFDRWRKDATT